MKYRKLIKIILGAWLFFLFFDGIHGKTASAGVRRLRKPFRFVWSITGMIRIIALFLLAAGTYCLIAKEGDANKKE